MKSYKSLSIIIWCSYVSPGDAVHMRMVRVDTGEEMRVKEGSFLLRILTDASTSATRCTIRHIASGQEAYVQGGPHLRSFVKACILADGESDPGVPDYNSDVKE